MSRHKPHLDPEAGAPFYPLTPAQCVAPDMIEAGARAMAKADGWHRWQGYATQAEHCLRGALAVAPRTPAGCAAPTIDDIPSCGQENDYRRARPTPAASEGPFNAEMPSSLNDACRRLDLAQERISQLEAQVEEASGLIHDLLGLELGSSERAMAWLDSRSDTSTVSPANE